MRFLSAAESSPRSSSCSARAFALAACLRSGIGYFLSSGKPKSLFGKLLRVEVVNLLMIVSSGTESFARAYSCAGKFTVSSRTNGAPSWR